MYTVPSYDEQPSAPGRPSQHENIYCPLGATRSVMRERGVSAMQFNFVVSTKERAVRLCESLGFGIVGRLPLAFDHPTHGFVDALVMFRPL